MAKQAVSKPNRNSLKGLWGGTMAKQAEGCAVLRLPKRNSLYLRWGGFPKETVCTSDGEVRWQSKRRVVRWQVLPVWRALKLRKAYNMPWQWQSRHEPCCTPTVIPGAAPPRPRLGRGRQYPGKFKAQTDTQPGPYGFFVFVHFSAPHVFLQGKIDCGSR